MSSLFQFQIVKHIPRKRFGQHFLVDEGVIHAIVNAINPKAGELLVEIGPGLGALTRPLLDRISHLHVVELDRDIIARLKKNYPPERLAIHEGDALRFDFGSLGKSIRVCGNLPYNISSPLLFHLMNYADTISDMTFMLQKEVVDRMVAEPSTPAYGRLSVMLQRRLHMEWLLDVPPQAFDPPPRVDSAVVRLIPKAPGSYPELDDQRFAEIVLTAFSQRRKTLRNTLGKLIGEEVFIATGIDSGLRAENLGVAEFEKLTAQASR